MHLVPLLALAATALVLAVTDALYANQARKFDWFVREGALLVPVSRFKLSLSMQKHVDKHCRLRVVWNISECDIDL